MRLPSQGEWENELFIFRIAEFFRFMFLDYVSGLLSKLN